jgi:hypothetical protein
LLRCLGGAPWLRHPPTSEPVDGRRSDSHFRAGRQDRTRRSVFDADLARDGCGTGRRSQGASQLPSGSTVGVDAKRIRRGFRRDQTWGAKCVEGSSQLPSLSTLGLLRSVFDGDFEGTDLGCQMCRRVESTSEPVDVGVDAKRIRRGSRAHVGVEVGVEAIRNFRACRRERRLRSVFDGDV